MLQKSVAQHSVWQVVALVTPTLSSTATRQMVPRVTLPFFCYKDTGVASWLIRATFLLLLPSLVVVC